MNKPYAQDAHYLAHLKEIEQHIEQGRLGQAAQALNGLSREHAHDPRLFLLASRMAEVADNGQGMVDAARKAVALAPGWTLATMHLATMLAYRGESQESMELADRAVRQSIAAAPATAPDMALLERAVLLAQGWGLHAKALQWLRLAEEKHPDSLTIKHQIARSLLYQADAGAAVAMLNDLLQQKPNHPTLLLDRMRALLETRKYRKAIADGEALLELVPDHAHGQFYLSLARKQTPPSMPVEMVRDVFAGMAPWFDDYTVIRCKYQLPKIIAAQIRQWYPQGRLDVLDLGCGTGLLGACLGRIDGALIGVDVTPEMTKIAARHKVYDRFHLVNLLDALQATPAEHYDLIAALDVFPYVGALDSALAGAYRVLQPGGRLVFSCEKVPSAQGGFCLLPGYRYAHVRSYVEKGLESCGFGEIVLEDLSLRVLDGVPVEGFWVSARKAA